MEQRRRDLRAGEENKSALVQPGVGERQTLGLENQVIIKKEIEIEGAFCPALAAHASVLLLDGLQELQEGKGRKDGGNRNDRIQVKSLAARPTTRLTFVKRRSSETAYPRCRAKMLPCRQQVGMAITKVGAESDKSADRGARGGIHGGN